MKLAVKTSAPGMRRAGSANTWIRLAGAFHSYNPDLVLFSDNQWPELDGVSVYRMGNAFLEPSGWQAARSWVRQQMLLEAALGRRRCAALLCFSHEEAILKTLFVPQIIIVHDLIPLRYPHDFPTASRLWKLLWTPSVRNAAAIITVSENTKRDLVHLAGLKPDRVFVIPWAYNEAVLTPTAAGRAGSGKYLLYVASSQYPYKNIPRLLEAFRRIRAETGHQLFIVANAENRFARVTESAIDKLGLRDSVKVLSKLAEQELAGLYHGADVFVYPSLYEGFGMPPLEAMAARVPVIASNQASIPEVCGDAALYVDPHDVESLAEAMLLVMRNRDLRAELVRKGVERAQRFRWTDTARMVLRICEAASEHRRVSPEQLSA